jgi:hypothetical protein
VRFGEHRVAGRAGDGDRLLAESRHRGGGAAGAGRRRDRVASWTAGVAAGEDRADDALPGTGEPVTAVDLADEPTDEFLEAVVEPSRAGDLDAGPRPVREVVGPVVAVVAAVDRPQSTVNSASSYEESPSGVPGLMPSTGSVVQ